MKLFFILVITLTTNLFASHSLDVGTYDIDFILHTDSISKKDGSKNKVLLSFAKNNIECSFSYEFTRMENKISEPKFNDLRCVYHVSSNVEYLSAVEDINSLAILKNSSKQDLEIEDLKNMEVSLYLNKKLDFVKDVENLD